MGVGAELHEERSARGLSLDQVAAAIRVRRAHLEAIEAEDFSQLPGPVYTLGYLRAYAEYLGVEMPASGAIGAPPPASLSMAGLAPAPARRLVLTGPVVGAAGLLILLAGLGLYAAHEFDRAARDGPAPPAAAPAAPPIAAPAPLPSAPALVPSSPGPPKQVSVMIRTTQQAWLYAEVDGQAPFGSSGRFLAPGQEATLTGSRVKLTSGRGAATLVSVDGQPAAPLGPGVATREFTPQNP